MPKLLIVVPTKHDAASFKSIQLIENQKKLLRLKVVWCTNSLENQFGSLSYKGGEVLYSDRYLLNLIINSDDPKYLKDFNIFGSIVVCRYPENTPIENARQLYPTADIFTPFSDPTNSHGITIEEY